MYKKRFDVDRCRSNSKSFELNSKPSFKLNFGNGKRGEIGQKKGQVTIFIILGLLLLLALALIILLKKEIITFKPEEIIPTEKGKIKNYIDTCIKDAGEEALFKIGLQGGYIEVPTEITADGNLHLKTSPFTVVPYWAYGMNTNIPSLQSIKEQIDDYLEQNVRNCLLETQAFQEAYDIVEKSDITADTEISDNKVLFNVHWNLEIRDKAGEIITEIIDHTAESDIKLKRVYEASRRIVEREMETLKFEDITQDLIALEHPNVPVAGMEMSCKQKVWKIETVKNTLQDMLRVNIRELKVKGTDYIEFPEELPYYQNHYIFDLGDDFSDSKSNSDVSVLFTYENNYPFVFEVAPRSGLYMKSNQLGGTNELLSLLCAQAWKFVYDVSFPVLTAVTDETTGYTFKTAFTVHVKKNIPDRSSEIVPRKTFFYDTLTDEEFCKKAVVPMTVFTYGLIEDEPSGVYDREPLENVDLTFTCLKYQCNSGKTEYDFAGMGDVAAYKTNFPYCVGGIIRGKKEGYKDGWVRVVTSADGKAELDLAPLLSFPLEKVKVVKHELVGSELVGGKVSTSRELRDKEVATIKLTYFKGGQSFHEVNYLISKAFDPKIMAGEQVDFLAGADFTYALEVDILNEDKFIGGYKGNWTVSWDKLQEADEIIIHTVGKDSPNEEEMYGLLLGMKQGSTLVPAPEIK